MFTRSRASVARFTWRTRQRWARCLTSRSRRGLGSSSRRTREQHAGYHAERSWHRALPLAAAAEPPSAIGRKESKRPAPFEAHFARAHPARRLRYSPLGWVRCAYSAYSVQCRAPGNTLVASRIWTKKVPLYFYFLNNYTCELYAPLLIQSELQVQ